MFTRAGRIAAVFVGVVACASLARCGGGSSPTEPGRAVAPTPSIAPAPTSTPPAPTPLPTGAGSVLSGRVSSAASGATPQYLSGALVSLRQDGGAEVFTKSGDGSQAGTYAFCCLRPGPAVIRATLADYFAFAATVTIAGTPTQFDIRLDPVPAAPAPTLLPAPAPPTPDVRSRP